MALALQSGVRSGCRYKQAGTQVEYPLLRADNLPCLSVGKLWTSSNHAKSKTCHTHGNSNTVR